MILFIGENVPLYFTLPCDPAATNTLHIELRHPQYGLLQEWDRGELTFPSSDEYVVEIPITESEDYHRGSCLLIVRYTDTDGLNHYLSPLTVTILDPDNANDLMRASAEMEHGAVIPSQVTVTKTYTTYNTYEMGEQEASAFIEAWMAANLDASKIAYESGTVADEFVALKENISTLQENEITTSDEEEAEDVPTPSGGSGWSSTAISLLGIILKAGGSKSDQSANITALMAELNGGGGGGGGGTTYTVTNSLTNCTNSNVAVTVTENSVYVAAITANDGYELDSVVCTMGGIQQTVSSGVITIAKVTGNIVITASASEETTDTYLYHFDSSLYSATANDYGFSVDQTPVYVSGKFGKALYNFTTSSNIQHKISAESVPDLTGDFTIAFFASNQNSSYNYGYDTHYLHIGTSNAWGYNATNPEMEVYADSSVWTVTMEDRRIPTATGCYIDWSNGKLRVCVGDRSSNGACVVMTPASGWDSDWHMYALTRSADTIYFFIDGKLMFTLADSGYEITADAFTVLSYYNNSSVLTASQKAYLDELLIDESTCRYTADFDVPTSAYSR